MSDIAVIGSGGVVREVRDLLRQAGFDVGFDIEAGGGERCPVVLGDTPGLFGAARKVVDSGRHLLLASPASLLTGQVESLLAARRPKQAVFLWSERRYHPAYRLVSGLVEAGDPTWQPRYVRHATFTAERPHPGLLRWRLVEGLALAFGVLGRPPASIAGAGSIHDLRGGLDFASATVRLDTAMAYVQIGLGEALERREAVVAARERKAYIDEMNTSVPVRLVDDEADEGLAGARWVSCPAPAFRELARLQCVAFLEATRRPADMVQEAQLWQTCLATLRAFEASLSGGGAPVAIDLEAVSMRVIRGGGETSPRSAETPRLIAG